MKFRIVSDLHLEFERFDLPVMPDEDITVLILAGDIHTGKNALPFIEEMLERFAYVIYVMGNHEFYGHNLQKIRDWWWIKEKDTPKLIVLDDEIVTIEDVQIFGGTLWTKTRDVDIEFAMNDYNRIGYINRTLTVSDTADMHENTVYNLRQWLNMAWGGKRLVVTHHLPTFQAIHPRYAGDKMNIAFASNLDYFLPDVDMWVFGHTHDSVDMELHGCRLICNPRGYQGYSLNKAFDPCLTVEL